MIINEAAISAIIKYMEEYLLESSLTWSVRGFERRSYSRWAANELLERFMDQPMMTADMIIEEFIITMSMYSCVAEDTKASFIFSVAVDTAEDINLYLKGENV